MTILGDMISCNEEPVEPPTGCDLEGKCEGTFISGQAGIDKEGCVENCQIITDCNFWTHDSIQSLCYLFADCPSLDESCSECVSGQRNCTQEPIDPPTGCDLDGKCDGTTVNYKLTDDRDACVLFCQSNADCAFWTYDSAQTLCYLFSDCPVLDETCLACVSGERECPVGECRQVFIPQCNKI